ncbi:MAG TPA: non-heme iron oxygenase ferredoxin subunit [Rhodocyclaceae bacterium]|nr:non-heme iron oxygenase ferredoxin subunit [Rhodocyclaceae bacterium]
MRRWIDVVRTAESWPGASHLVEADGTLIAVFNVDGIFHAIADTCSHEEESLSGGILEGTEIICPAHGARFSVVTGEVLEPPACESVASYPVRITDGMVQVYADLGDSSSAADPAEAMPQ